MFKQIDLWPDKIFFNGKIVTVDGHFTIEEAVAIKGEKFVAAGGTKEVLALAGLKTEKTDLERKTALPGFIDTHPHLAHAGPRSKGLNLRGLRSIQEIKDLLKRSAERFPPGQWIVTSPVGDPPYFFKVPGIFHS